MFFPCSFQCFKLFLCHIVWNIHLYIDFETVCSILIKIIFCRIFQCRFDFICSCYNIKPTWYISSIVCFYFYTIDLHTAFNTIFEYKTLVFLCSILCNLLFYRISPTASKISDCIFHYIGFICIWNSFFRSFDDCFHFIRWKICTINDCFCTIVHSDRFCCLWIVSMFFPCSLQCFKLFLCHIVWNIHLYINLQTVDCVIIKSCIFRILQLCNNFITCLCDGKHVCDILSYCICIVCFYFDTVNLHTAFNLIFKSKTVIIEILRCSIWYWLLYRVSPVFSQMIYCILLHICFIRITDSFDWIGKFECCHNLSCSHILLNSCWSPAGTIITGAFVHTAKLIDKVITRKNKCCCWPGIILCKFVIFFSINTKSTTCFHVS